MNIHLESIEIEFEPLTSGRLKSRAAEGRQNGRIISSRPETYSQHRRPCRSYVCIYVYVLTSCKGVPRRRRLLTTLIVEVYLSAKEAVRQGWETEDMLEAVCAS